MPLDIILFAIVAAVLVYRLRDVLGTRHDEEPRQANPFETKPAADKKGESDNVVTLNQEVVHMDPINPEIHEFDGILAPLYAVDGRFHAGAFIEGAREAFPYIVEAFARGERDKLKPLLSPELYETFEKSIASREELEQKKEAEVLSVKKVEPLDAHVDGSRAFVTVKFITEEVNVLRDKEGKVLEGDPDFVSEVTDIWTFSRDVRSKDPNWILIRTQEEAQSDGTSA